MIVETTTWKTKEEALAYCSGVSALSDMVLDYGQISITVSNPKKKISGIFEVTVSSSEDR